MLIVLTVHIYTIRKIETRDKHLSAVYAPEKKGGGRGSIRSPGPCKYVRTNNECVFLMYISTVYIVNGQKIYTN